MTAARCWTQQLTLTTFTSEPNALRAVICDHLHVLQYSSLLIIACGEASAGNNKNCIENAPQHCHCETELTINQSSPHLQQDLLARALGAQLLHGPRQPRRHQDRGRRPRRRRQPSGHLLSWSRAIIRIITSSKPASAFHEFMQLPCLKRCWQLTPHAGADRSMWFTLRSWLACWWLGSLGLRSTARSI